MKDVRIDQDGELRCWKCGARGFTEKRTARSKVLVGVGALATKKKLKCQSCGEYNDVGNAKPYKPTKAEQKSTTTVAAATTGVAAAGWHPDPMGRYDQRYWDGVRWTEHVTKAGAPSIDPI